MSIITVMAQRYYPIIATKAAVGADHDGGPGPACADVADDARQLARLQECQGALFADRTPAPTMRANPLRLWLASFAYVLMCAVRRIGLAGTKLATATCGTMNDCRMPGW